MKIRKRVGLVEDSTPPEIEGIQDKEGSLESGDPINFWEKKQRELLTSVVDYNLSSLAKLVQERKIDLSPGYQRRHRWDTKRQSRLIESFLMNVPVPPIYLNEDKYGKYSVIDGKQRLLAISAMMQGRLKLKELEVFKDVNDKSIDELPEELKTILEVRPTVRAVIILRQSDPDIKFEVFRRLNTGGVRLNAQEIRNSTFPGPLNDLILRLSDSKDFHSLLRIRLKNRSAIWREMRDAEFVLRYFTFAETWEQFDGGMRRKMDHYMEDNQHLSASRLELLENNFTKAVEKVSAAMGEYAFRRWQPEKASWREPVVAALYDAEMFGLADFEVAELAEASPRIIKEMKTLFSQDEFRKAVDAATNTPSYFKQRIKLVRTTVREILRGR